jgi:hypothetical protein
MKLTMLLLLVASWTSGKRRASVRRIASRARRGVIEGLAAAAAGAAARLTRQPAR